MKPVNKEEFYKEIGPLDVTVNVEGNYPYTCYFKFRNGTVKGKSVERYAEGSKVEIIREYFIN